MRLSRIPARGRWRTAIARAAVACTVVLCATAGAAAQIVLDQVLVRFGGEIVTQLDVRQARLLKLVSATTGTDQAYVDALVDRRLILADLKRIASPEPPPAAIDAKVRQWTAGLGPGADVAALLDRAGMTDAGLRGWMRDDLRIQTYLDQRFAGRSTDIAAWIGTLRQRAGIH
jgi:hypothetical protein